MKRKNLHLRLILPLIFCLCLPHLQVVAQDAGTAGRNRFPADSLPANSVADSAKEVKLVYYSVPSRLTAASTAAVYNKDLIKSPVTNVLNALTGRLSGISTEQSSGQPGQDGVSLLLHGRAPLILIDGVARNLTTLDLEEIESVTVLKDAVSTAMLGVRGANGAIQITTRKGSPGRQTVSFTAQSAIQQPLHLPQTLNAYNYALLRNEAIDNDLRINPNLATSLNRLRYTTADLQAYQNGTDPFGHPDVDWQSQLLKKTAMLNRYSLNASGGNSNTRFFVALEHLDQEGLLKENPANNYGTNNYFKSYSARTNVDINITPKLSGGIALFGRIINGNEPGAGVAGIFSSFLTTPNNAYPVYNRDSSFGGSNDYRINSLNDATKTQSGNLQGLSTGSGYLTSYRRDILADFNLKRTLNEITPGLWIKGRLSYSSNLLENITRTKVFVAYGAAGSTSTPIGATSDQINTNAISTQGRSSYTEVSAGYARTFSHTHGIDVLVMANRDNMVSNSDLPYTISGTSGKLSYNYKEKYILEGAYAYNGSNRYTGGKTKYGFFPSIGAAWNITNEAFAKNQSWLSNLKLFASYGKSGWDNPGYYVYLQRYVNAATPYFGTAAGSSTSLTEATLAYPNITWEKANKANAGIQGAALNNHLGFTIEYYNNKFSDLLIQRGRNTSLLGNTYPNENIGINRYAGMDFQLSWQQQTGSLHYFIAANASVQHSKVLYMDEVKQPYDYMRRTGQMAGRPFGYVADGLFQSAAEITGKATFVGYTPQPGDIRYKDLNKDGIINQLDQTAIGSAHPLVTYGVNLGFTWRSLDFSALVQGAGNRNLYLIGNRFYEFQNGGLGQAYQEQLDRWTPTNTAATYPRLSIGSNSNNQAFSSFWVRSGDYVRLKNVEIGYTLPSNLLKKARLSTARVFANGLNLLTSTKVKNIDPEVYNGAYPIQRLFNFGINIKL